MKINDFFSFRRLWLLVKRDVLGAHRAITLTSLTVMGVYLVISGLLAFRDAHVGFPKFAFELILTLGGMIVTSRSFSELYRPESASLYLTLPASTLEKFVGRFLLLTVGWSAFALAGMIVVSALSQVLNLFLFGQGTGLLNPFDAEIWSRIGMFIVMDTLFLAGALYFRKNHLVKTLLSVVSFFFVLAAVAMFGFFLLFGRGDANYWAGEYTQRIRLMPFFESLKIAAQVFCWSVFPAFWLVFSFFRLKEAQIRNAVQ